MNHFFLWIGFFLGGLHNAQAFNSMHPPVISLNASGTPARNVQEISEDKTCGKCHDVGFIHENDTHSKPGQKRVACLECHLTNPTLLTSVTRLNQSLRAPMPEMCHRCHGPVSETSTPVLIPDDYAVTGRYSLGKREGAYFSGQPRKESGLNLANKDTLQTPWDIHAARRLECVSCHRPPNHPQTVIQKTGGPEHLRVDPRFSDFADYLKAPDHKLQLISCEQCHNTALPHAFLPFPEKHLNAIECTTCHIPEVYLPTISGIDETGMSPDGKPILRYAGLSPDLQSPLNAVLLVPRRPVWLRNQRNKIAPFLLSQKTYFVNQATGLPVRWETVQDVYQIGGTLRSNVISVFNPKQDESLRVDSTEKLAFVLKELRKRGVQNPQIKTDMQAQGVFHGVMQGKNAIRVCGECHDSKSRSHQAITIEDSFPPGTQVGFSSDTGAGGAVLASEGTLRMDNDQLSFIRNPRKGYKHVIDWIGLTLVILAAVGTSVHAGLRWWHRSKRHASRLKPMKVVYLYGFYERVWHWVSVLGMFLLIGTGMKIHWNGAYGFQTAVLLHHIVAAIVLINAFFSLFYHLASAEIRQFIPPMRGFLTGAIDQFLYYTKGIFHDQPHPFEKSKDRKMNIIQQITYLGILNVLLPAQVFTGLGIYLTNRWYSGSASRQLLQALHGTHLACTWLFVGFLIVHIYMTTTGHRVSSHLKAMITGFEEIPEEKSK